MRIALLSYSTKPRGGVVHTLALGEALAAEGQDVTVWTLGRGGDSGFFRPVDPRVRLRVVPFSEIEGEGVGPRILRSIDTLRAAFEPAGYDVVHAQDCISANAVDRCVRTVHHIDHFTTPELAACHERALVRPYAHVCVSAAVADELAQGWGIKATVIPNGVEAARFAAAASPAAERQRQRWRERLGRYVLSVGGIEPRKGSLELLEAFALLTEPDVRLVIAGGETLFDYREYRARWEKRAVELGVSPVVLGAVAHDELPFLVAAAGAFAFPSRKEGFGLAAMEAVAAGVPLVVSDLPVLREVFGGVAGFGSDAPGLALELARALAAPDPARRAAGESLAGRYTWRACAKSHIQLYHSLTG
ncbi:MSMEG_0565 family glycosyltransferase [Amycolatopsis acidiphila]|uniref:MSMEG_0565 family glycosyltransferase n=1 Tax=Amycolatopsis acidiphila TaxID=715473 RepID=A0A558ANZ2_9PSEU|nr:MSMEG_0565 family glycosyltransferase [Amycolatopsis acidiphila]TVT25968.1 MSMEG_0565 family glycosyltransferase [Amycolatopsis acidiphila]UIJ63320.1 MSMEG_0565 family glycosyltransferase [Amycolatopsis acidiphila]GHG75007.1 glycosyl transferase family 1 [Amycolatopsis acidiphila]